MRQSDSCKEFMARRDLNWEVSDSHSSVSWPLFYISYLKMLQYGVAIFRDRPGMKKNMGSNLDSARKLNVAPWVGCFLSQWWGLRFEEGGELHGYHSRVWNREGHERKTINTLQRALFCLAKGNPFKTQKQIHTPRHPDQNKEAVKHFRAGSQRSMLGFLSQHISLSINT